MLRYCQDALVVPILRIQLESQRKSAEYCRVHTAACLQHAGCRRPCENPICIQHEACCKSTETPQPLSETLTASYQNLTPASASIKSSQCQRKCHIQLSEGIPSNSYRLCSACAQCCSMPYWPSSRITVALMKETSIYSYRIHCFTC